MLDVVLKKWNSSAAVHLTGACDDNYQINDLAYDVQKGNCDLFHIYEGAAHVGSMVLRVEGTAGAGRELVVVALGGRATSGALIQCLTDFWDKLAKQNNAKSIRAHVSKEGMVRLMERAGGSLSEYVFRKKVV